MWKMNFVDKRSMGCKGKILLVRLIREIKKLHLQIVCEEKPLVEISVVNWHLMNEERKCHKYHLEYLPKLLQEDDKALYNIV
jgi:hypothetical protein